MADVTGILMRIDAGNTLAAKELLPVVYAELRKLAAAKLANEEPGQTLQATALVHEAYLRLVGELDEAKWANEKHFFAAAATAMRRILIERARRKNRKVHGGNQCRIDLNVEQVASDLKDAKLLELDNVLTELAKLDPIKAKLVELRFFGGLTGEQAAEILGVSAKTADRYWVYCRAWLRREMKE